MKVRSGPVFWHPRKATGPGPVRVNSQIRKKLDWTNMNQFLFGLLHSRIVPDQVSDQTLVVTSFPTSQLHFDSKFNEISQEQTEL